LFNIPLTLSAMAFSYVYFIQSYLTFILFVFQEVVDNSYARNNIATPLSNGVNQYRFMNLFVNAISKAFATSRPKELRYVICPHFSLKYDL